MLIEPDELEDWWEKHWKDMPEFSQEDQSPVQSILVHFYTKEDVQDFAKLVQQRITTRTRFIRFPNSENAKLREMGWFDES